MENIKKRILLTAVSGNDPYTIKFDEQKKVNNYNYGSMLSILRKLNDEGNSIDEIYLYLSFEMAVREVIDNLFSKSIKSVYKEKTIKITFFPENVVENLTKIKDEIVNIINGNMEYEILDKKDVENIILPELNKDDNKNIEISDLLFKIFNQIAFIGKTEIKCRIDVHKFGTFYSDFNDMLNKLKEENEIENCDIYINISSGTSAMQSDFNLMGITNFEINAKIMQTSTPDGKSNNYTKLVHATTEDLEELEKTEHNYMNRVNQRDMITTKRLILLKNLESSFKKRDFAGVANAINQDSNIVTKEIENYANNLYYRYIGDEENARGAEKEIVDSINLYPLSKLQNEEFRKDFENIIEKFNVMKTKVERNEFNDWLLISTPIIEKIIEMILEVNGISKKDFIGNINQKEKISLEAFEKSRFSENEKLRSVISKNNGEFPSAYRYMEIMEAILNTDNKDEIMENVRRVDTTRSYRIRAAHSADFVVKGEFERNIYKDFYEEFENRIMPNVYEEIFRIHSEWNKNSSEYDGKNHRNEINIQKNKLMHNQEFLSKFKRLEVNKNVSRVDEVHNDIKKLLKYIYDKKSEDSQAFEDACNMYKLIENRIIELLKEKINEYK